MNISKTTALNVLGTALLPCCSDPLTGYYRDGYCNTDAIDIGTHVVCAQVTTEFLKFSSLRGNNLTTAIPQWKFPGLKDGDFWCLCISRWREAEKHGIAPKIKLESTHEKALKYVSLEKLKQYAL